MRVNKSKTVLSEIVERTELKTKKYGFYGKKKNPANPLVYWIFHWRRRRDSNSRAVAGKLISSPQCEFEDIRSREQVKADSSK